MTAQPHPKPDSDTMDFSTLQTDPALEKMGVWKKMQDAEFLIGGSNSPKYQRGLRRHAANESANKIKNDPEAQDRILVEAMADGILLDWRGKVTLHGEELACTRENKIKLLLIHAFRNWVAEQMQEISNFQKAEEAIEDEDAKKL